MINLGSRHIFANAKLSIDDSVAYIGVIRSVIEDCQIVLDVGCGRGAYADDRGDARNFFDLRGANRQIFGLDIDSGASTNPFIDRFIQLTSGQPWLVSTSSVDMVVSDWTLEHVKDPGEFISELKRVLRPGGVFVARSINRRSILSAISRLVPNAMHARVLKRAQPNRLEQDIFPAYYRMNTLQDFEKLLGRDFEFSVIWRPGLHNYVRGRSAMVARGLAVFERLLPNRYQTAFVLAARLHDSPDVAVG